MLNISAATAGKFVEIIQKPGATQRTKLLLMLHTTRNLLRQRDAILAERKVFRRGAAGLKASHPQMVSDIKDLERKRREHRGVEFDGVNKILVGIGDNLLRDPNGSFKKIGFDGVCDLIGVNLVNRLQHRDCKGLAELVFGERAEDCTIPTSCGWGEGGPLFEACFLATAHWFRTAPKEDLPDLFGPCSPFAGARLVKVEGGQLQ